MEARAGAVLGPFTILKEDYFPGMKSTKLPQTLAGASNFRCMRKERVYGVAMSTLAGIRNVLRTVQQQLRNPDEVGWLGDGWDWLRRMHSAQGSTHHVLCCQPAHLPQAFGTPTHTVAS